MTRYSSTLLDSTLRCKLCGVVAHIFVSQPFSVSYQDTDPPSHMWGCPPKTSVKRSWSPSNIQPSAIHTMDWYNTSPGTASCGVVVPPMSSLTKELAVSIEVCQLKQSNPR